jgi:hypothetical protein
MNYYVDEVELQIEEKKHLLLPQSLVYSYTNGWKWKYEKVF